ncbi:conserved hypothetical protein [Paenibacillus curdlanolyticus YK9]|uniref:DUF4062 domain-containing protein n=1 Tax=Paenibacillus curdlanolyticus YK9 TaxID=717606 RepID=E0IDK5_9BACL|nr:DUF4062 domain-containing protein [Paenibacillus curdlanolyticus]EFM09660.1 conserved hypothetical protein [Paenibacillus curdlanolyticus YK9]
MPIPTKVFISSVAQDELSPLREKAFADLARLGHDPQMFEKNFGPWPMNASGVKHCLDKVSECDLYFLYMHTRGGSMTPSGQTVTHLEFLQAVKENKELILYATAPILDHYFRNVRWAIKGYLENQKKATGKIPDNREVVDYLEIQSELSGSSIPSKHVYEMYVWVMLHDIIDKHGLYVEALPLGSEVPWESYLSDKLRQGLNLLPKAPALMESVQLANQFGHYTDFSLRVLLDHLSITDFINLPRLLNRVIRALHGAEITYGPVKSAVGRVEKCSAVSLFHQESHILKITGFAGDTDGNRDFDVNDPDSFVSYTYLHVGEDTPALFYDQSKRMIYLTFKMKEYVISYHFPEATRWDQQLFATYTQEIIDGIINEHANDMIFQFMNSILGGLQK